MIGKSRTDDVIRYVRVAPELYQQLRDEPSGPVTLQIVDEEPGNLISCAQFIATRHDCPSRASWWEPSWKLVAIVIVCWEIGRALSRWLWGGA
jgi:hypothetical protein